MRPFERITPPWTGLIVAALALCLVASVAAAQCTRPTDCLPPQGGDCVYVAPNTVCYPGTPVCVRDLELVNPSHCVSSSMGTFDSFFDITYRIQRSTDSGLTWTVILGTAPGGMHFAAHSPSTTFFDTEMLQLDLTGDPIMRIRESPTLQSSGFTTVTDLGGSFQIDSFFDVFTELSVDGGQTWMPSDDALHMALGGQPSPVAPSSWGRIKALYR